MQKEIRRAIYSTHRIQNNQKIALTEEFEMKALLPILLLLLLPALAFAQPDFEMTKALAEQGDVDAQFSLGVTG